MRSWTFDDTPDQPGRTAKPAGSATLEALDLSDLGHFALVGRLLPSSFEG
jgi:hypothetical protein